MNVARKVRIGRRALLRGGAAGAVAVGLPWLEIMSEGKAAAAEAPPARFFVFMGDNGVVRSRFFPTGGETDFTLSETLQPLAPYRNNLIALDGVDMKTAMAPYFYNGHYQGRNCNLTGTKSAGLTNETGGAGGISLDQYLAQKISQQTKLRSLEYGINGSKAISFLGARQEVPYETSPQRLFDRLFTGVQPSTGTAGPNPDLVKLREDRKSVLDAVQASYGLMAKRLGKADRVRMDAHAARIRDTENRLLSFSVSSSAGCRIPARPGPLPTQTSTTGQTDWMDLYAYAFACDLTRVATVAYCNLSDVALLLGLYKGNFHDDVVHFANADKAKQDMVVQATSWEMGRIAAFIDKLKSIPEGPGTVFDNTLILNTNDFTDGYTHRLNGMPYLLLSGSSRFFRMGRYLKYAAGSVTANQMMLSIMSRFGVDDGGGVTQGGWGDRTFGSTPLPNL